MSAHPARETLQEYAWDAADLRGSADVEAHVSACPECALFVEKCRAESRRIRAALETPLPPGLAARILDAATPAGRAPAAAPRRAGRTAAAAAALLAAGAAWAWHRGNVAIRRVERLEHELAARPAPPKGSETLEDTLRFIDAWARTQTESATIELLAGMPLHENSRKEAHDVFLAMSDTTAETLGRWSRGEVDTQALLGTDTLASLEPELKRRFEVNQLDDSDYQAILAAVGRRSRAAADGAARGLIAELQAAAALSEAQAETLRQNIVGETAWRRDFAFMPEVARRELVAAVLGTNGALRTDVERILSAGQKEQVSAFLRRDAEERGKFWEELRRKH